MQVKSVTLQCSGCNHGANTLKAFVALSLIHEAIDFAREMESGIGKATLVA